MNPGDMAQGASRSGLDDTTGSGAASAASTTLADSPRTHEILRDIQDIVDKLAAVTKQLRRPSERRQPGGAGPGGAGGAGSGGGAAAQ